MAKRVIFQACASIPENVTDGQIQEWIEFELGYTGRMKASNPLTKHDINCDRVDVLEISER